MDALHLCRIEPLVCKEFVEKRPKFIPYHKGGKRLHIGMQVRRCPSIMSNIILSDHVRVVLDDPADSHSLMLTMYCFLL
jgi:hypothetical protein